MKSSRKSGLGEKMPKVSVIIPVYNGEKFLSEAIESVMAQTYPDWEIIAVDGGSTDKTPGILKKYKQQLHSKMLVISQKSNVSVARNIGINASRGEYIAFLDHDDLWLPEKLERQVELLDSNKEVMLVYSDSYIIDSNGNLKKETMFQKVRPYRGKVFNELFYVDFIPTLTVVVRKEVFGKVGMFNPEYRQCEDYDLWLRIAERYPIDYLEQPLAKYRIHEGGASRNTELSTDIERRIMEYWLNKKPELREELKRIKQKKARLHYQLAFYYLHNYKIGKAIREFINWGLYKSLLKN